MKSLNGAMQSSCRTSSLTSNLKKVFSERSSTISPVRVTNWGKTDIPWYARSDKKMDRFSVVLSSGAVGLMMDALNEHRHTLHGTRVITIHDCITLQAPSS